MGSKFIKTYLKNVQDIMCANREYLIDLDSVVGDGDLGLTMSDGFTAAYESVKMAEETDIGKLLYTGGKAMSTAVPSTMGTLMASGLMQAGKVLKGKTTLALSDIAQLFQAYMDGVQSRGKAQVGDKTFLDGIAPAVAVMHECVRDDTDLAKMAEKAMLAAEQGFKNTTTMLAIHGRAATRGEASRSLLDPGAAVAFLLMQAFNKTVEE